MNVSMSSSSNVWPMPASEGPRSAVFSTEKKLEVDSENSNKQTSTAKIDLRNASMADLAELRENGCFPAGFIFPLVIPPYYPISPEDHINHKTDYLAQLESSIAMAKSKGGDAQWFEDALALLLPFHSSGSGAAPAAFKSGTNQALSLNAATKQWTDDQVVEQQRQEFLLKLA